MNTNKKGFTLLELIVVIIIVGVLATLGFVQYTMVIEKGRKGEARNNLGMLRQLEIVYYQERERYSDLTGLATGLPAACNQQYYFSYQCDGGVGATGNCTATRCTANGKTPNIAGIDAYVITLTPAGTFEGTGNWQ